jgi:hypothetical protein
VTARTFDHAARLRSFAVTAEIGAALTRAKWTTICADQADSA